MHGSSPDSRYRHSTAHSYRQPAGSQRPPTGRSLQSAHAVGTQQSAADRKRAAIIATRPNVVLGLQKIANNVAQFQYWYISALVAGYGNDAEEVKARTQKEQAVFNGSSGILAVNSSD